MTALQCHEGETWLFIEADEACVGALEKYGAGLRVGMGHQMAETRLPGRSDLGVSSFWKGPIRLIDIMPGEQSLWRGTLQYKRPSTQAVECFSLAGSGGF